MHFFLRYCEPEHHNPEHLHFLLCSDVTSLFVNKPPSSVISHAPAAAWDLQNQCGCQLEPNKNLNDKHKAITVHFLQHLQDFSDGEKKN